MLLQFNESPKVMYFIFPVYEKEPEPEPAFLSSGFGPFDKVEV